MLFREKGDISDKGRVIPLTYGADQVRGIIIPTKDRVISRRVIQLSLSCGTYGQGGPGFLGFLLAAAGSYPEEWLICRLWSAGCWLNIDGRWLCAHPDQYDIQRPFHSSYQDLEWDELSIFVVDQDIIGFDLHRKHMSITIGKTTIKFDEDPNSRPIFPGGRGLRKLTEHDDLREVWIISPEPWVQV